MDALITFLGDGIVDVLLVDEESSDSAVRTVLYDALAEYPQEDAGTLTNADGGPWKRGIHTDEIRCGNVRVVRTHARVAML